MQKRKILLAVIAALYAAGANAELTTADFLKAHSYNGPKLNGCMGKTPQYVKCLNDHGFDGVKWVSANELKLKLMDGSYMAFKRQAKYKKYDFEYAGINNDRYHQMRFSTGGDYGDIVNICVDVKTGKEAKCPEIR